MAMAMAMVMVKTEKTSNKVYNLDLANDRVRSAPVLELYCGIKINILRFARTITCRI